MPPLSQCLASKRYFRFNAVGVVPAKGKPLDNTCGNIIHMHTYVDGYTRATFPINLSRLSLSRTEV